MTRGRGHDRRALIGTVTGPASRTPDRYDGYDDGYVYEDLRPAV